MKEFIASEGNIILNAPYAEAYIPESLFRNIDKESEMNTAVAYLDGDAISTVGLFNIRFMPSDSEKRDKYPLKTFAYPSQILTYPTRTTKEKLVLTNADKDNAADSDEDTEPSKYYVLHYYRGDIIMSANTEAKVSNCEKFLEMLTQGKIPNTIPYHALPDIWMKNFNINDTEPGVPSVIMQFIIAEQCRYAKDPRTPFRKKIGKGSGVSDEDYMMQNMRTIASYNSTFAALTFEDISQMICSSVNMTRQNLPQNKSPIEKVLSY